MAKRTTDVTGIEPLVVNVFVAGALLGVSPEQVRNLIAGGKIAHVRVGRRVMIEISEIYAYLDRQRTTEFVPRAEPAFPAA
jgi:excisionase family DNA binding protein